MTNKPEDNKTTDNTENPETSEKGPETLDDLFNVNDDKYAEMDAMFEDDDEDEEYTLEDYIEENADYIAQYQKTQEINVNLKNEIARLTGEIDNAGQAVNAHKQKTINEMVDALSAVTGEIDVLINDQDTSGEKLDNMKQGLVLTQQQFSKIFNESGAGQAAAEQDNNSTAKFEAGDIPTAPEYDAETESEQDIMIKFIQANTQLASSVNKMSNENGKLMREKSTLVRKVKRLDVQNEECKQQAIKKFATNLLDVADNLERATQYLKVEDRKADPAIEALATKIEGAASGLQKVFNQFGVEKLEAKGAKFDPNFHEALMTMPANEAEPDHVEAVMQEGYTLHGKLLRPARVGVAQK